MKSARVATTQPRTRPARTGVIIPSNSHKNTRGAIYYNEVKNESRNKSIIDQISKFFGDCQELGYLSIQNKSIFETGHY